MRKFKVYGLILVVVSGLLLVIAQSNLTTFKAGDVIKAEDMNANFAALQARITELEKKIADGNTNNPTANGYLGSFTQIVKQSDNFVCIPLLKDWKDTGCVNGKPSFDGYTGAAVYLDNSLINNKADVRILIKRDASGTVYPEEAKNGTTRSFLESYRYNGDVAYDSSVGKWYVWVRNASAFLGCRRTCAEVALDVFVFSD